MSSPKSVNPPDYVYKSSPQTARWLILPFFDYPSDISPSGLTVCVTWLGWCYKDTDADVWGVGWPPCLVTGTFSFLLGFWKVTTFTRWPWESRKKKPTKFSSFETVANALEKKTNLFLLTKLICFLFFLRHFILEHRMIWKSLCSPGRPQTPGSPSASAAQVQG